MGLFAQANFSVEFDDRLLAHLQVAIVRKFRRSEPLVMSWLDPLSVGDGRSSVWLTPTAPAYFKFYGSRVPRINDAWLQVLSGSANSSTGLIIVDENGEYARATGAVRFK